MLKRISNRLPALNQITPVYAVIIFMSAAWMILAFVWKLPAWLYFQTVYEILPILAYAFMQIFFDSLLYLGLLLLICVILPARFFKDEFSVRGTWAAIGLIGTYIAFVNLLFVLGGSFQAWTLSAVLIGVGLAALSARVGWLASFALQISDRLIIFLYILLPVSAISILTVIIRNLN